MIGGSPRPILHSAFITNTGPIPILPPPPFITTAPPHVIGYVPPPPPTSLTSPTGQNFVPLPYAGIRPMPDVTASSAGGAGGRNPLEVRGGTVYFSPEVQKPPPSSKGGTVYYSAGHQTAVTSGTRSPARRQKAAIPIINPEVTLGYFTILAASTTCDSIIIIVII